jgi:glucose/arabinose dehydrogenase
MTSTYGRLTMASVIAATAFMTATAGHAQQPATAGGRGQGQQQGARGGGRGQPRPECLNPKIPAAECNIGAAPMQWADPVLGDGPFVVQSAVPAHRNLRVVVMAKFQQPWSIAFLPDGNVFVTERPGRLRIIRNGVLDPNPVPGVPRVHAQGLQGLMDVVLHPRFADNKWVYIAYHKPVPIPDAPPTASGAPAMAGATTLMRGTWNGKELVDVKDIFESGATRTESSRIGFGRDGMLYMSISASGTGPDVFRSADPNDYAGKTVRLRDDGTIPPDNPFVNKPGYKPGIYTLGHRNGHSMALNPEDEVNVLKPGANYGWPYVSNGRNYMGPKISENPWRQEFEAATVVWVPSIAVAGGTFYTGDRFPGWKRNFFVGGLREGETPRTGQLQRIEFNDKWEEIRREPMLRELHQRIRDVRQGPDGLLYVVTGEDQGALLRIEPGEPVQ